MPSAIEADPDCTCTDIIRIDDAIAHAEEQAGIRAVPEHRQRTGVVIAPRAGVASGNKNEVYAFCAAAHECVADADCGSGQFCKIGAGNLDRNTCRTMLADWDACTGDRQCSSGQCSDWRPQDGQVSGVCYTPNSKQGGDSCKIDLECAAGACNSNKRCVCKKDVDCTGNQWCDRGADLHENSCRAKLANGQACGVYGDLGVSRRCNSGKCSTKTGLGVPGVTTLYCQA
jgi:Cys-rich repeat protein